MNTPPLFAEPEPGSLTTTQAASRLDAELFCVKGNEPIMETDEFLPIVLKAQAGCRASFGELVKQFETTVYSIALRRLRNSTEAAELTQDVFVQAMRKLDQLREPERFPGWLRRITVRLAINRSVRRPPVIAQDPVTFCAVHSVGKTPLEELMTGERCEQLLGGLKRLRELDRRTLMAFYFEGQSLIEMSDRFRSPVGTIKRRLHTARNRLRQELDQVQPV